MFVDKESHFIGAAVGRGVMLWHPEYSSGFAKEDISYRSFLIAEAKNKKIPLDSRDIYVVRNHLIENGKLDVRML